MKQVLIIAIMLLLASCESRDRNGSVKPEGQISFALESKPHSYYVKQAELWWKEIENNSTAEENWFNYYRACRNAQGTADWRQDFVDESPYLRLGFDIVKLMEQNIPNSFTYNFVKGSTSGVDPSNGPYLLKAYEMNPNFPGIQAAMITYAVSTDNAALRKQVNQKWNELNTINPGLIQYASNVLKSLEPEAILLTQHDNDSYPAWLLQDAHLLRSDVMILNIDFLLHESLRKKIFNKLGIPPFELEKIDINEYRKNWKNVVQHFFGNYDHARPLYVGLTVSPEWYEGFEDQLHLHGLTYRFTNKEYPVTEVNKSLYEEVWHLEKLNEDHEAYYGNYNVLDMNTNYLRPLEEVYQYFIDRDEAGKAEEVRILAIGIANRTKEKQLIRRTDSLFARP